MDHTTKATIAESEDVAPEARKPTVKEKTIPMTSYLMPEDHKRIRVMLAEEGNGASFQKLFMDGIDRILAERGMPVLTRWDNRRRQR